jgi:carbamoyl-phosphate synthase large subunit
MKKINILVTGAGGGGVGDQIIKALRGGTNKYYIVSTDVRSDSVAKCIGDVFCVLPSSKDSTYLSSLINCSLKYNCKIIIPGSEPELLNIASNIDLFIEAGIYVPINHSDLIKLCSDKIKFNEFLKLYNFKTPETLVIDNKTLPNDLNNFPYVVKPISGSGSKNVFIVQNIFELSSILEYLGEENGFLLQQYVGSINNEYTVGILCTPNQGYVNHIILKRDLSLGLSVRQSVKNNSNVTSLGEKLVISTGISQGVFVSNILIDEVVKKIVKLLNPTSTINLQCRIHENEVFIFEINPRFSGTTNLRAIAGFNEPEYIINEYLEFANISLDFRKWENKQVLRGIVEYLLN